MELRIFESRGGTRSSGLYMPATKCGMGAICEQRALHMQNFRVICLNLLKGQYVAYGGLSKYGISQMEATLYAIFANEVPVFGIIYCTFLSEWY